ncbi:MAG: cytochrome c4 [Deinococcus sp.]|uniref:cytochrome c4 n=1 Tax=Deinococcus sp. TaxID=47478 RepID=UPI0026DC9959|nr:cytochrome c4 [Deinococcus sp.]MDO4246086.1 cytochrome c4 [Deinococcus sp.]
MSRLSRSVFPRAFLLGLPLLAGCTYTTSSGSAPAAVQTFTEGAGPLQLSYQTPSAQRGAALAVACAGCHGPGGVSTRAGTPGLAGQVASYSRLQLTAFRAKLRPSGVMHAVAAPLSDQNIADLAAHYAALEPGPAWKVDPEARARGMRLFTQGDAARNLLACQVCHGADGRGVDRNGVASVTHLSPEYGAEILEEFHAAPSFGGLIWPEAMRIAVQPLSDQEMKDLAAYMASLGSP